jgi:hypothetical protein
MHRYVVYCYHNLFLKVGKNSESRDLERGFWGFNGRMENWKDGRLESC